MIKKSIIGLILLSYLLMGKDTVKKKVNPIRVTIKGEKNVIILRGKVNTEMKDRFIEKSIQSDDNIFVYIDSPGGSVYEMNEIINYMKHSGKQYVCVAKFAASAAFSIFQFCQKRYMIPFSSISMQHDVAGQMYGDLPAMKAQLDMWLKITEKIDKIIAKRMKISLEKYKQLIANDLWLTYDMALEYNAVDSSAFVTCTKKALNTWKIRKRRVCSFIFGCKNITIKESLCPLISPKEEKE